MSVTKRADTFYLAIRPFGKLIYVKTPAATKAEGRLIEMALLTALKIGDYRLLDTKSREVCMRLFHNQGWELPPDLGGPSEAPEAELTLWKAIELTVNYPEVRESPNLDRHKDALFHVTRLFGKGFPVKDIRIPQVKEYQIKRQNEGAASSTINKERAAMSRMFGVLIELGHTDYNPVKMVKALSERDGQREVYVSFNDFNALVAHLPSWAKPIVQTLYFTGMRRNEAVNLTWENVNLKSRIIRLAPSQTKERKPKRIPIHRLLIPTLEAAGKVRSLKTDRVFLDETGTPPHEDSLRKPWVRAVKAVGISPAPTIRDLRHVWKTNAMRSGMDFEIREAIMGHYQGVTGRYGRLSDADLVQAIDGMEFDHGDTEIWVAREKKTRPKSAAPSGVSNRVSRM